MVFWIVIVHGPIRSTQTLFHGAIDACLGGSRPYPLPCCALAMDRQSIAMESGFDGVVQLSNAAMSE